MRNIFIFSLVIFLFFNSGCFKKEKTAIKIDTIELSAQEFEQAFKTSSFSSQDDPAARRQFLDTYISRKLILQEAEKSGLDKDAAFLGDIQLFWEQLLLKLMLSKKINESLSDIKIEDKEVKEYYLKNKENTFSDKELAQVSAQIKWLLFKEKQGAAIQNWADGLRKKAKIEVDYKLLGMEK